VRLKKEGTKLSDGYVKIIDAAVEIRLKAPPLLQK
jgi:hypothetical protein